MEFKEIELTSENLCMLMDFSAAWEKEQSCYGYVKNEKEDISGSRVFVAYGGEKLQSDTALLY